MGKLDENIGKQATEDLENDLEEIDLPELGDRANKQLDDELETINSEFGEKTGDEDEDKEEIIEVEPSDISVEESEDGDVIDVDPADISVEEAEEDPVDEAEQENEEDSVDQEAEEIIARQRESEQAGDDPEETEENMIVGQREAMAEKEMESSYQALLNIQGQFVKAQEGKKKLNKLRALLGGKKSKEATEVAKDFDSIKEEYEKAKEGFRDKFGAFGLNLVNGKRFELENEGEEGKELKYKLLEFMHIEKVIDSGEKDRKGEAIMRSISEEYNKRLFDLDSAKIDKLPSKTKQLCKKALEKYQKLPKAAKIALGTSVAVAIGAVTGGVGTVGAAAVYGGQRAARSYLGGLFGAAASGGVSVAYETAQGAKNVKEKKTEKDFKRKGEEDLAEQVKVAVEDGDDGQEVGDVVKEGLLKGVEKQKKVLDEMNEHQRKQLRNRMIAAGVTGVAVGGGIAAIADGMVDTDSLFGTKPKAEIGQSTGKGSVDIENDTDDKAQKIEDTDGLGGKLDDAEKRPPLEKVRIIPDEKPAMEPNEKMKIIPDKELDAEPKADVNESLSKVAENGKTEELRVVPGEPIELEKGDSVWGSLKDRNLSDREIMNKVNSFSKQMGEELVADGVSPEKAKEFINWRFGHMDVGENFVVDESGNLVVEDFLSQHKLEQFGISTNEELGVIDTSETASGEPLSSRLDENEGVLSDQQEEKVSVDQDDSAERSDEQETAAEEKIVPKEETIDPKGEISSLSGSEKGFIVEKLAENQVDSKVFDQINGSKADKVMDAAAERLRELSKASMGSGETADSLDVQRTMGLLRHMRQTVEPFENETFAQYIDRYSNSRNFRMDDRDLERLSNIYKQAYLAGSGESLNVVDAAPEGEKVIEKEAEKVEPDEKTEDIPETDEVIDERSVDEKKAEIFEKRPGLKVFDSFENFLESNGEEMNYRSTDIAEQWARYKETAPDELKKGIAFRNIDQGMQRVSDAMDESNTSVAMKQLGMITRRFANLDQNHEFLIRGTELAEKMGIDYDPFDPKVVNKMENGIITEIDGHEVAPEFLTDQEIEKVNKARAISGKELMEKGSVKASPEVIEQTGETTEDFQGGKIDVSEETFEKVGQFSPKQVEDAVFADNSEIGKPARDFLGRVIATNLNAKAGESFEEYMERYFDNEDVPAVTQKDLDALQEIYEKVGNEEWKKYEGK